MTYWPNNTDWGVGKRYFIAARHSGRWAVEDGDMDVGTPPVAEFSDRASALRFCRQLNTRS